MDNRNLFVVDGLERLISSMQQSKLVRCAITDCLWAFKFMSLNEIYDCYEAFRRHCVDMHELDPDDSETMMSLDTQRWMMRLAKTGC